MKLRRKRSTLARRIWLRGLFRGSILTSLIGLVMISASGSFGQVIKEDYHRSPVGLVLLPDGKRALTANHTSDSVSLVDIVAGKVLAEVRCGKKPIAVACSPDGKRAAVSSLWSGTISLVEVGNSHLKVVGSVTVGAFPRGLVFAQDGNSIYAAIAGKDEVVQLSGQVFKRWPAPHEPRHLALSNDGKWLAAASSRSAQVRCWNLKTGELHWERKIEDAFNLRGLAFSPDDQAVLCVHNIRREFPVSKDNIEEGWVIDSRVTKLALKADASPSSGQIALDIRGKAVGDPNGLAFGDKGKTLAIAAGGTHELLLWMPLPCPGMPVIPAIFWMPICKRRDSAGSSWEAGQRRLFSPRTTGPSLPITSLIPFRSWMCTKARSFAPFPWARRQSHRPPGEARPCFTMPAARTINGSVVTPATWTATRAV